MSSDGQHLNFVFLSFCLFVFLSFCLFVFLSFCLFDDEVQCCDAGNRGVHISTSLTRLDGALDVKLWRDQERKSFSYLNPIQAFDFDISKYFSNNRSAENVAPSEKGIVFLS